MKVSILADNTAGKFCRAEHGLSYLIETSQKYLFDTGSSDLFLWNAQQMRLSLDDVDTVILSHGHDDHSGGLVHLKGKTIIAHPGVFLKRFRNKNNTQLGIPFSLDEADIQFHFNLKLSEQPIQLDEVTWFLGEVPRVTDFESQETIFHFEDGTPDFIPDDSGMAVITPKGLVIISGCAHAGICNTIIHAQYVTGVHDVYAVIGGFHLTDRDDQLFRTIEWLKEQKASKVMPSHCTSLPALTAFYDAFGFIQVKTGNSILI